MYCHNNNKLLRVFFTAFITFNYNRTTISIQQDIQLIGASYDIFFTWYSRVIWIVTWLIFQRLWFFLLHSSFLSTSNLIFKTQYREEEEKSFSFYYLIFFLVIRKICAKSWRWWHCILYTYIAVIKQIFCAGFFLFLRFKSFTTIEALNLCLNYNFMFEIFFQGLSSRLLPFAEFKLHHRKFTRIILLACVRA